MEEYIDVDDIKGDTNLLMDIYQFNCNDRQFIKVGSFNTIPKELINRLRISENVRGDIFSHFYSFEEISDIRNFNIISMCIFYKKEFIGELSYEYNKSTNKFILIWTNESHEQKIIETFDDFIGNDNLIELLCSSLIKMLNHE